METLPYLVSCVDTHHGTHGALTLIVASHVRYNVDKANDDHFYLARRFFPGVSDTVI